MKIRRKKWGGTTLSRILNRLGLKKSDKRAANKARMRRELNEASQPLRRTEPKPVQQKNRPFSTEETGADAASDPFREERIFQFQITPLESALGTSREIAMPGARDGKMAKIRIKIPRGIKDGTVLQIARGWDRVKVRIVLIEDPYLRLEGKNLYLLVPITLTEAVNGVSIDIPTLEAPSRITVDAGADVTQPIRLEGKGLPGGARMRKQEIFLHSFTFLPRAMLLDPCMKLQKPSRRSMTVRCPANWELKTGFATAAMPGYFCR